MYLLKLYVCYTMAVIVVVFYVCNVLINRCMLFLSLCYCSSLRAGLSISRNCCFVGSRIIKIAATVRLDTFHCFGDYARMRTSSMFLTLFKKKHVLHN